MIMSNIKSKNQFDEKIIFEVKKIFDELFPICRSITGNGVRQSLKILQKIANFDIKEIPSGTSCYDWIIPNEWNVEEAYIEDSLGNKIIDFKKNNLHLVGYSVPIDENISFNELKSHLHMLPDLPDAIPYRTSYYEKNWGFCLSKKQFEQLDPNESYHVKIKSKLEQGSLTYGEYYIKGKSSKEYIFSTYCCHPSLANDNLSGMVLWALLLRELQNRETENSYRFVIAPETIGAIAYLSENEKAMKNVTGGFILMTVAGPGKFSYKESFLQEHEVDVVTRKAFQKLKTDFISYPFHILGGDETEFSSPYFRIPIGVVCKDKYYEYDYYHTSLDNLEFISPQNLIDVFDIYIKIIDQLEKNQTYISLNPQGEPMLGKRDLYPQTGGAIHQRVVNSKKSHEEREYPTTSKTMKGTELDAMLWLLFYGDGENSLLEIEGKTNIPLETLHSVATTLCKKNLLKMK